LRSWSPRRGETTGSTTWLGPPAHRYQRQDGHQRDGGYSQRGYVGSHFHPLLFLWLSNLVQHPTRLHSPRLPSGAARVTGLRSDYRPFARPSGGACGQAIDLIRGLWTKRRRKWRELCPILCPPSLRNSTKRYQDWVDAKGQIGRVLLLRITRYVSVCSLCVRLRTGRSQVRILQGAPFFYTN
jgi:hypothetical protein